MRFPFKQNLAQICVLSFLLLSALSGCRSKPTNRDPAETRLVSTSDTSFMMDGIVVSLEDIGYPYFVLKLKNSDTSQEFLFNIESNAIPHHEAYGLKDKMASVAYSLKEKAFVDDIVAGQKSLFAEYAPDSHDESYLTKGILSGADMASQGDLPGSFTITPQTGRAHSFEFYIDDELAALNGKEIEVYYSYRFVSEVTSVKILE